MWPNRSTLAAWREFKNKLEAFIAFATSHRWIGKNSDPIDELIRTVNSVVEQEDFFGLWAMEGVGYYWTLRAINGCDALLQVFSHQSNRLPERSIIPLHTGMGLALASDSLRCLRRHDRQAEVHDCIQQFLQRCKQNSLPGYAGAAVEALGLVVCLLQPTMLIAVDRNLNETNPDLVSVFWHGVGRGLYFTPINVLPCSAAAWPSLHKALQEPPHEIGRENVLAGLAWAVALINIRNPDVLELFVERHGLSFPAWGPFANGVTSAAAVWQSWAPHSDYLQNLCHYRASGADATTVKNWEKYARGHCHAEFANSLEDLRTLNRIDELFRIPVQANERRQCPRREFDR
jgi:hypothetical protein